MLHTDVGQCDARTSTLAQRKSKQWKQNRIAARRARKRLKRLRDDRTSQVSEFATHIDPSAFVVRAPKEFILEEQRRHDALTEFLTQLRSAFASDRLVVTIDFRPTIRMVAGGSLLFFCELNRLVEIFPLKAVRCIPAKNNTVGQVLTHLGIYRLCNYESDIIPTRKDVVTWKTDSADYVNGRKVGEMIETSLSGDLAKQAFRGASEAMINCVNHAYEASRKDGLPDPTQKKWWMFCREDEVEKSLFIAVCDLGIGIPGSLPLKYPKEMIDKALEFLSKGKRRTDSRLIQAALEIARTRTDRSGRGLGLYNLKRIIDDAKAGRLYIFSNAGLVKYQSGVHTRNNFKRSILGTVVVWAIPIGVANE